LGKALVLLRQGRHGEMSLLLAEAQDFIRSRHLVTAEPLLSWVEGQALAAAGELAAADAALRTAHDGALSFGQRCTLLPILGARARLAESVGDHHSAARYRTTGVGLIDAILQSIADETLAAGLRSRWQHELQLEAGSP